jgi:hypothetical protein
MGFSIISLNSQGKMHLRVLRFVPWKQQSSGVAASTPQAEDVCLHPFGWIFALRPATVLPILETAEFGAATGRPKLSR